MADIPLRPLRAKFFGGYIVIRPGTTNGWAEIWTNFDLDWFADQVDQIKSLGGNCVCIGGDVGWYTFGGLTLAQYLDRRRQVAEMIASKGVYFLPYGTSPFVNWGGGGAWPSSGTSLAVAASILADDAEILCKFPNCIGYITVDEPWFAAVGQPNIWSMTQQSLATVAGWCQTLYDAVKAVVPPDIPVAIPDPMGDWTGSQYPTDPTNARTAYSLNFCDAFFIHFFYGSGVRPSTGSGTGGLAAAKAAYPNKDFFFPSAGAPLSYSSGERSLQIAGIMDCGNANRGSIIWCVKDYVNAGAASSEKFGMYDGSDVARTDVTGTFASNLPATMYPIAARGRVHRGKPRLNALRRWGY